jgi:O-methyltransferase
MIRKFIRDILEKRGIFIVKQARYQKKSTFCINDLSYDFVNPAANYAPWNDDKIFNETYNSISSFTLVDKYRCFEIWELAEKINAIDKEAAFIEIGVWRGGTAAIVGKKLSTIDAKVDFYLADTFEGVPKSSEKDPFYNNGEHNDTSETMVKKMLSDKYNNYTILKGIFPEATAHNIPNDQKFGYCHIDVDVYKSAKDIVNWIWDKMIVGGVIVFDDYGFHTCNGITKYVNELKLDKDKVVIHNLNGHAIIVKVSS